MTAARKTSNAEVREILVEDLMLSPDETRKTIDQAALQELAESVREKGVIEALLVRPVEPGPARTELFEIVSGQRRWLAAKLAGKTAVPCIVREMSDDEAAELRVISNLQREDLPPMEEAEAYGKLLCRPGSTIDTVAAALAKSATYVGRCVQLLKAIEPVRRALKAGVIEVGHALELARLDEARQRQMLTRMQVGATLVEPDDVEDEAEPGVCRFCGCSEDDACDGGCSWANEEQTICTNPDCLAQFREETGQEEGEWQKTHYSVVELRREIAETAHVDLKNAPFPLFDEIEPMACTKCPKCARNSQLLFNDCAQDTCTDRSCYYRKVNLWIESQLDAAKSEKRKLLKLTDSWTSDKDKVYCREYHGVRVFESENECQDGEEGIWIDGRNIGRRAMICRNRNCKTHFGGRSSSSSSYDRPKKTEKQKADRRKILDKVKSETAYRSALVAAIAQAKVDVKVAEDLNVDVCCALIGKTNSLYAAKLAEAIGWDEKLMGWAGDKQLRDKVAALPAGSRLLIARLSEEAGELSVSEYDANGKCEDLEKLARLVGVDAKKVRASLTAQPAPLAKAEKPAKSKRHVLSPGARKRVADAQQKRWKAQKVAKKAAKKRGAR